MDLGLSLKIISNCLGVVLRIDIHTFWNREETGVRSPIWSQSFDI